MGLVDENSSFGLISLHLLHFLDPFGDLSLIITPPAVSLKLNSKKGGQETALVV
jgi:hypothetical protein